MRRTYFNFVKAIMLSFIIVVVCGNNSFGQRQAQPPTDFYPILIVDVSDDGIGGKNFERKIKQLFQNIALSTGMTNHPVILRKPVTFSQIKTAINAIPRNSNSTAFLYYYGHSSNCGDTKFPGLSFYINGRATKKCWPELHKMVKNRNITLAVSIMEGCNHGGTSSRSNLVGTNLSDFYPELFQGVKGDVIACSSKKGQYSLASKKGGLFGRVLLGNIHLESSWKNLKDRLTTEVKKQSKRFICEEYLVNCNCNNGRCNQEPYFEINLVSNEHYRKNDNNTPDDIMYTYVIDETSINKIREIIPPKDFRKFKKKYPIEGGESFTINTNSYRSYLKEFGYSSKKIDKILSKTKKLNLKINN